MPANWTTIETAIQAWAVRASQMPSGQVAWGKQGGPRLQPPFVELLRDGAHPLAQIPELQISDNPASTGSDGQEILIDTISHAEFTVTVSVYTVATVGAGAAVAIAGVMANEIEIESELDTLDAAGLALVEVGTVQNLTAVLETEFEGRASFDLRLRVVDGFEETATYIETVIDPTGTITE